MNVKAVIFDMDGVLVDSEHWYLKFFRDFLVENGKQPDEELLLRTVGASNFETWRLMGLMWGDDISPMDLEKIYRSRKPYPLVPFDKAAFPGMQDILRRLNEKGIRVLIASASFLTTVERMTVEAGIKDYVYAIVSGEQVKRSKPAPDVYLRAVELSGIPLENCIAVEDSAYGVMAAQAAGLPVIGVDNHLIPTASDQADYRIHTVADLFSVLDSFEV